MSEFLGREGEGGARILTAILRRLVAGPLPPEVARAFLPRLGEIGPREIVDAVDALVAELEEARLDRAEPGAGAAARGDPGGAAPEAGSAGLDLETLKPAVSKLLNLLHARLSTLPPGPSPAWVRLLEAENAAIREALDALSPALQELNRAQASGRAEELRSAAAILLAGLPRLEMMERHYGRKENVLFPRFEASYPRYRCLAVMWSLHDEARRARAAAGKVLAELAAPHATEAAAAAPAAGAPSLSRAAAGRIEELNRAMGQLFFSGKALIYREERILHPLVASLLDPAEALATYRELRAFAPLGLGEAVEAALEIEAGREGLALSRGCGDSPATTRDSGDRGHSSPDASIDLDSGSLSPALVNLILKSLPLDMTFVDAEDRVRYFSDGPERVFPRSPAIIGREVRNCHPAESVGRVMAILEAFRRGERDRESFWLELRGRFIHIEYRAIRDAEGRYLGCLEISRDLTEERSLRGEKRLASF